MRHSVLLPICTTLALQHNEPLYVQLEQMDLEVINEPSSSRGKTKTKIADFKKELDDAERQLRRSRVAMSNSQTARCV